MDAPKDGNTHLFELKYRVPAFWDQELDRWVLNYPIKMEYLPARAKYIGPGLVTNGDKT